MKKKLVFLLSLILILNTLAPAATVRTAKADGPAKGQVSVSVGLALILQKEVTFRVSLEGQAAQTVTLKTDGEAADGKDAVRFEGLAAGTYLLEVTADGFADYRQEITVKPETATSVKLLTGFVSGMNYMEGAAHPGVLLIGDVDGSGTVDGADKDALVDAVDAGSESAAMDVNGDGRVDLVDLEYFTRGYKISEDIDAWPEESLSPDVLAPKAGANTEISGDLDSLLRDSGSVTLSPSGGDGEAEISEENPVSLEIAVNSSAAMDGLVIETGGDNPIAKATVEVSYTDADGSEHTVKVPVEDGVHHLLAVSDVRVTRDSHGNIQVHLGSQVAVKKVTLTIMAMQKNTNLAEISKVEFVNGMEERIPEPELDIPRNLSAAAGSKSFTLSWSPCVNVTGYEVVIAQGGREETHLVTGNSLGVTQFNNDDLLNNTTYTVKVQSLNGTWRSGYSDSIEVTPKPDSVPAPPDNVKAEGAYRSVEVSWKNMKDTESYILYYREGADGEWQEIPEEIKGNRYVIGDLKDRTEYTVYVVGVNHLGRGGASLPSTAITTDMEAPVIPKYHLINTGKDGEKPDHIIGASGNGTMMESPLDTAAGTAWGTVDHNPASYYERKTWDDGGYNGLTVGKNGLTYEFDRAYKMDTIALQNITAKDSGLFFSIIRWWDENGEEHLFGNDRVSVRKTADADGRVYYLLKLSEAINAKKIQIGLATYAAMTPQVVIAEVYFYYYDELMDEIMALYEDDLHTVLRAGVTQETINDLRRRLNEPDKVSGEQNPNLPALERELKTAEDILNDQKIGGSVQIHAGISTSEPERGFGGLNAWQPLGVSAAAGETITVYVGHPTKRTGDSAQLQLVATQYHAESSPMDKVVTNLKVGANVIRIPKIWTTDAESGGALYVQYTGSSAEERYAVRVSGGVQVPKLDLYGVSGETERLARAEAYVSALETYVAGIEDLHRTVHAGSENSNVNRYEYGTGQNCILGASDILLDTMMLSLPAQQILSGLGTGTVQEKAQRLADSMRAVEEMMALFYQHKGLNSTAEAETDRIPRRHLNIRYQRMFAGAFMYASGNHIGIEWPETAGMVGAVPVVSDSEGRYQSGAYFGWGIAHEIGHCINQSAYAVAEITNNYFAQLAQAKDRNEGMRFDYANVYGKVTSGALGASPNLATQLAMYWQLHLAYDDGYNYRTYADYSEQLESLFYARVDTYARDTAKAPQAESGGVALKLGSNTDQNLMRLACAAAEKNILSFFERWGMIPDAETQAYAGQFAEETRAIYYVNDDARVYRLTSGAQSSLGTSGSVEAVGEASASVNASVPNQVDLTFTASGIPASDILGYEIVRCTVSGGETVREPVGFATENRFSDVVTTMNNRVVFYEITLIDKYLNRSAVKTLAPVKIEHDGSLDKTFWTVSSEGLEAAAQEPGKGDEDSPCAPKTEDPLMKLIDHNVETVYRATASDEASVILNFNQTAVITGLKYTPGEGDSAGEYEILVYTSQGHWISAAKGSFGAGINTVYFRNEDGKYVSTYEAYAVRLILRGAVGRTVSAAEIDVLGVTGDNVDFRADSDGGAVIGRLSQDYVYADGENDRIPAGSVVFVGSYKGNPAYNAVILFDGEGNPVGGLDFEGNLKAQQIILATVPEGGMIEEVSDGTWIYWIEPEQQEGWQLPEEVRVELYRVNNALTNEGQRLVSDSLPVKVPAELPEVTLDN